MNTKRSRKLNVASISIGFLSISALISFSTKSVAAADPGCEDLYGGVRQLYSGANGKPLTAAELTQRTNSQGATPVQDIFPVSRDIPAGSNLGKVVVVEPKNLVRFKQEFDDFLELEAKINPDIAADMGRFRVWMRKKPKSIGPYPEVDPKELGDYIQNGRTIKDLFYDQYSRFLVEYGSSVKEPLWNRLKSMNPRTVREIFHAIRHSTAVATGIIGSSMVSAFTVMWVMGPAEGFLNAVFKFDSGDSKKMAAKVVQQVTGLFEGFEGGKEKFNETLKSIDDQSTTFKGVDFSKLERGKVSLKFAEVETSVGNELVKFSSILDRIDTDRAKKTLDILKSLAGSIVPISVQNYTAQSAALKELESRIAERNGLLTAEDKKELEDTKQSMKDSEREIARVMAIWKIYKMSLPEKNRNLGVEIDTPINAVYMQYMRFMDTEIYREEFLKVLGSYQGKLKEYNK